MPKDQTVEAALAAVGPRLREVRTRRGVTLTELAAATGISKSTLSRLESGQRRPSLELLLPIAMAHEVSLDELVAAPRIVPDPAAQATPRRAAGRTVVPLTRRPSQLYAHKLIIAANDTRPNVRTHAGHVWMYVLAGNGRLLLGDDDLRMGPGEAVEFDTSQPHWFGSTGNGPVEILIIYGGNGERIHLRTRPAVPHTSRHGTAVE